LNLLPLSSFDASALGNTDAFSFGNSHLRSIEKSIFKNGAINPAVYDDATVPYPFL
jgi:hypothetical protein